MLQAVLFDLDDTLLGNAMETFMHNYLGLLSDFASAIMDKNKFIEELLICTRAMIMSSDTAVTNRNVFWQTFAQRNGIANIDEMEQFFDTFYREQFPLIAKGTRQIEAAPRIVNWCQNEGINVVVATNSVFPTIAIEERLRWAGLPVTEYEFGLITTYENMHSTKPHPSYYQEILDKIDCSAEHALMVGNDWENDMVPAAACGVATYWIAKEEAPLPAQLPRFWGQGSLDSLAQKLASGEMEKV